MLGARITLIFLQETFCHLLAVVITDWSYLTHVWCLLLSVHTGLQLNSLSPLDLLASRHPEKDAVGSEMSPLEETQTE